MLSTLERCTRVAPLGLESGQLANFSNKKIKKRISTDFGTSNIGGGGLLAHALLLYPNMGLLYACASRVAHRGGLHLLGPSTSSGARDEDLSNERVFQAQVYRSCICLLWNTRL